MSEQQPMGGPLSEADAAAARIRAYLDACADANSFGREIRWELRDADGNPYNLPRADLIAVLDGLAAEKAQSEVKRLQERLDTAEAELHTAKERTAFLEYLGEPEEHQ